MPPHYNNNQIAQQIITTAGRYLHNPIREPRITCEFCTSPTYGAKLCNHCTADTTSLNLYAPLTYTIGGQQSARIMRGYKDAHNWKIRANHAELVAELIYLGITLHKPCIEAAVNQPVSQILAVPSTRTNHPFIALTNELGLTTNPTDNAAGQHVMLLDDTWSTGTTIRTIAQTLRSAGATTITAMTVGRWINPEYGDNAAFIQTHARAYDPHICPVTGTHCK